MIQKTKKTESLKNLKWLYRLNLILSRIFLACLLALVAAGFSMVWLTICEPDQIETLAALGIMPLVDPESAVSSKILFEALYQDLPFAFRAMLISAFGVQFIYLLMCVLIFLVYVPVIIFLIFGLNKNLHKITGKSLRFSPTMAVLWFLTVFFKKKPYQAIKELVTCCVQAPEAQKKGLRALKRCRSAYYLSLVLLGLEITVQMIFFGRVTPLNVVFTQELLSHIAFIVVIITSISLWKIIYGGYQSLVQQHEESKGAEKRPEMGNPNLTLDVQPSHS